MNKSVMISIQPKWCELIASGKKTIEVRKTRPQIDTPFKCYIYETKYEKRLMSGVGVVRQKVGGKVIGEFVCNRIDDFSKWEFDYPSLLRHINLYAGTNGNYQFLNDYLKGQKKGYGWHISDLKIYDKPKELGEFVTHCNQNCMGCEFADWDYDSEIQEEDLYCSRGNKRELTRPPQSWCYCEVSE